MLRQAGGRGEGGVCAAPATAIGAATSGERRSPQIRSARLTRLIKVFAALMSQSMCSKSGCISRQLSGHSARSLPAFAASANACSSGRYTAQGRRGQGIKAAQGGEMEWTAASDGMQEGQHSPWCRSLGMRSCLPGRLRTNLPAASSRAPLELKKAATPTPGSGISATLSQESHGLNMHPCERAKQTRSRTVGRRRKAAAVVAAHLRCDLARAGVGPATRAIAG